MAESKQTQQTWRLNENEAGFVLVYIATGYPGTPYKCGSYVDTAGGLIQDRICWPAIVVRPYCKPDDDEEEEEKREGEDSDGDTNVNNGDKDDNTYTMVMLNNSFSSLYFFRHSYTHLHLLGGDVR